MFIFHTLAVQLKVWSLFNLTPFDYHNINSPNNSIFRVVYTNTLIATNVILLFFYIFKLDLYIDIHDFIFFVLLKITIFNLTRIQVIIDIVESWYKRDTQINIFKLIEQTDTILTYECDIKLNYKKIEKKENQMFVGFMILTIGLIIFLMCGIVSTHEYRSIHFWFNCLLNYFWNALYTNQFGVFVRQLRRRLERINEHFDQINQNQMKMNAFKRKVDENIFLLVQSRSVWTEQNVNNFTPKQFQGLHDAIASLQKASELINYGFNWSILLSFALNNLIFLAVSYTTCLHLVKYEFKFGIFFATCLIMVENLSQKFITMISCHYTSKQVRTVAPVS